MICCLTALSRGTAGFSWSSGPRAVRRPCGCRLATRADVSDLVRLQDRDQLTGSADVHADLFDQRLDTVEAHHSPQPVRELHRDVLAVEVDVDVQDVGL